MASPGLEAWLAWFGNGVEAPKLLACLRVVSIHKPAHAAVAATDTNDNLPVDGQRSKRGVDLGVLFMTTIFSIPKQSPSPGMQRQKVCVATNKKHAISQDCHATVSVMALRLNMLVVPDLAARAGI